MGLFGFGKDKKTPAQETSDPHTPPLSNRRQDDVPHESEQPQAPLETQRLDQTSVSTLADALGPYADSDTHLWHALEWADQLVRAQTLRWRKSAGAEAGEQQWGMVHVTEQEIAGVLEAPFMRANQLSAAALASLQPYWNNAQGIAEAIDARCKKTPAQITLRLLRLESVFTLSPLELAVVLVCLLPELDARYRRLFAYLQDDATRSRPSVELVLQILQPLLHDVPNARAVFSAAGPLCRHHLIEINDINAANEPLPVRLLNVDARIVDYLLGSDYADKRLQGLFEQLPVQFAVEDVVLAPALSEKLATLTPWLTQMQETDQPLPVFFLYGRYGYGRLQAARVLAQAIAAPVLVVDAACLRQGDWALQVDLILREALLRGAALYWRQSEILREHEHEQAPWFYLLNALQEHAGLVFLASETPWDPAARLHDKGFVRIDFTASDYALRRRLWLRHLPDELRLTDGGEALAGVLANGFQLSGGQIQDAVLTAYGEALLRDGIDARLSVEDLYEGCRRQSGHMLVTFARLIEPRTDLSFDDLILPESNKRQLKELRDRIRYRNQVYTSMGFERRMSLGKGLIALFTGASGTGKTMAAELLGREYGMQIYKVDLAAVVSKYVGETEKNLSKVFNEAEDANAILFFDEGEALFGKRGTVEKSQDRWANTEVNYLLQRIEEYRGVVIITTNFRQNMDAAFLRRLHASVDFPRPDAEARLRILRGMFPSDIARPSDDELKVIAEQFTLSGGNLKNAVLDAAFRAIAESDAQEARISIRHLVLGIAREEQKMGRALTKGDFGEQYHAWVEEAIL